MQQRIFKLYNVQAIQTVTFESGVEPQVIVFLILNCSPINYTMWFQASNIIKS